MGHNLHLLSHNTKFNMLSATKNPTAACQHKAKSYNTVPWPLSYLLKGKRYKWSIHVKVEIFSSISNLSYKNILTNLDPNHKLLPNSFTIISKTKQRTPLSGSYRPSDRRLSAKSVPTFADRECHIVSVMDPDCRILGFLNRSHYFFFQVAPQL
jgi:hypothetical protein